MIRGVVFDYGKVISFPPEDRVMEKMAALAGMDIEKFETLLWPYRAEYDRGTISGLEYYRFFLSKGGVSLDDETLRKIHALDLESWSRINADTVRLMEDIKNAGYKLGILSNMPHDFLAIARERYPVFSLPHGGIFSCESASIKPEEKIYRDLFAALSLEPEELVFFDDMPVNIDKACSLGMRGFVWQDPDIARETLRGLSIPV
ncbi:HAD family hydrolase [Treponema primitia]|uniref:HAD family hydrolase n=1 Tax=Treponema primitia TaxID=88058 RepID=UPI000255582C|nr:HAD family phosphatase [Treponema primitia]